ncbi:hypothetical protein K435DRAFT_863777 [Dendrothele bispora CBS 962.96]|uniref:Uncharacterized protein n=1 Tax=Dendrothele bispora (strain CBS 962.96) TaxID=1314807 RepID=A0A4S8LP29_DENBC|nr:hypothetical protein K435DRAFT_863777 [Dendrothele bispora CBS 962.96]
MEGLHTELIQHIARELDAREDQAHFRLACRAINAIVEPILFETVEVAMQGRELSTRSSSLLNILSGQHIECFSKPLQRKTRLCHMVRRLKIQSLNPSSKPRPPSRLPEPPQRVSSVKKKHRLSWGKDKARTDDGKERTLEEYLSSLGIFKHAVSVTFVFLLPLSSLIRFPTSLSLYYRWHIWAKSTEYQTYHDYLFKILGSLPSLKHFTLAVLGPTALSLPPFLPLKNLETLRIQCSLPSSSAITNKSILYPLLSAINNSPCLKELHLDFRESPTKQGKDKEETTLPKFQDFLDQISLTTNHTSSSSHSSSSSSTSSSLWTGRFKAFRNLAASGRTTSTSHPNHLQIERLTIRGWDLDFRSNYSESNDDSGLGPGLGSSSDSEVKNFDHEKPIGRKSSRDKNRNQKRWSSSSPITRSSSISHLRHLIELKIKDGLAAHSNVWRVFGKEGIRLERIEVDSVSREMVEYLEGYEGVRELVVKPSIVRDVLECSDPSMEKKGNIEDSEKDQEKEGATEPNTRSLAGHGFSKTQRGRSSSSSGINSSKRRDWQPCDEEDHPHLASRFYEAVQNHADSLTRLSIRGCEKGSTWCLLNGSTGGNSANGHGDCVSGKGNRNRDDGDSALKKVKCVGRCRKLEELCVYVDLGAVGETSAAEAQDRMCTIMDMTNQLPSLRILRLNIARAGSKFPDCSLCASGSGKRDDDEQPLEMVVQQIEESIRRARIEEKKYGNSGGLVVYVEDRCLRW